MSEDRLKHIEDMLSKLYARLERIESLILTVYPDPVMEVALELTLNYTQPVYRVVKVARKILALERKLGSQDPIARAIIEVLAMSNKWLSISEVTREVRRLRGSASRRIISERIKELAKVNVLQIQQVGKKKLVKLIVKEKPGKADVSD